MNKPTPKHLKYMYKGGITIDAASYNLQIDKTHLRLGFRSSNFGYMHISIRTMYMY